MLSCSWQRKTQKNQIIFNITCIPEQSSRNEGKIYTVIQYKIIWHAKKQENTAHTEVRSQNGRRNNSDDRFLKTAIEAIQNETKILGKNQHQWAMEQLQDANVHISGVSEAHKKNLKGELLEVSQIS